MIVSNIDKILNNIAETAELNDEEAKQLVQSFYGSLALKFLDLFPSRDNQAYEALSLNFQNTDHNSDKIQEFVKKAYSKPEMKVKIDKAVDEVLDELVDTIAKSTTKEQKQKILTSLTT